MRWGRLAWVWFTKSYSPPATVIVMASVFGEVWPTLPLLKNVALWPAALALAVLLHEAAHATVGRLTGLNIAVVRLGTGAEVGSFKLGGADVLVHLVVSSGAVLWMAPPQLRHKRLSLWLAVLAGPAMTLALCIAAWRLAGDDVFGWWRSFAPVSVFFWANAALAPTTMLPFVTSSGSKTDAYQLLTVPGLTDEQLAEHLVVAPLLQISKRLRENDVDGAEALLRDALARHPDSRGLKLQEGVLLLARDRFTEAYESFKRLLAEANTRPLVGLLQNNMAWSLFLERNPERLKEALDLSEQAFANNKEASHTNSTRGAVLYWSGDFLQATDYLEAAHFNAASPPGRALIESLLAMAYAKANYRNRAESWLRRAEESDRACMLLNEARSVVQSAPRS